jgi:hypothetical protein
MYKKDNALINTLITNNNILKLNKQVPEFKLLSLTTTKKCMFKNYEHENNNIMPVYMSIHIAKKKLYKQCMKKSKPWTRHSQSTEEKNFFLQDYKFYKNIQRTGFYQFDKKHNLLML